MQKLLFYLSALSAGVVGLMLLIPILGFIFLLLVAVIAFLLLMPLLARLPWFRNRIRMVNFRSRRVNREPPQYRQTLDVHDARQDDDVIDVVPRIISSTNDDDDREQVKPRT